MKPAKARMGWEVVPWMKAKVLPTASSGLAGRATATWEMSEVGSFVSNMRVTSGSRWRAAEF